MSNISLLHSPFPTESPIFFKVWERPLFFGGTSGMYDVPSHKAIVKGDSSNYNVLGIVGRNYKIVTTEEICLAAQEQFASTMTPEQLHGVKVRDRIAYHGGLCIRDYQFPTINAQIDDRGSEVRFRCVVTNGYDGATSIKVYVGAIDGFCENGMVTGVFDLIAKRHTSQVSLPDLGSRIRANIHIFYTEADKWKRWAKKEVTREMAKDALYGMPGASEKLVNKLLRQFDIECLSRGRNVWALFSAATYYASYNEGEFATRNTANDHTASTMLDREMQVRKWTNTNEFLALAA